MMQSTTMTLDLCTLHSGQLCEGRAYVAHSVWHVVYALSNE